MRIFSHLYGYFCVLSLKHSTTLYYIKNRRPPRATVCFYEYIQGKTNYPGFYDLSKVNISRYHQELHQR